MQRLPLCAGCLDICLRGCHLARQKSKHIQVVRLVPFRRELFQRDQRRRL